MGQSHTEEHVAQLQCVIVLETIVTYDSRISQTAMRYS
jgi:hypothetical protein